MAGTRWLDEREMAAWQGFLEATSRVSRHLEQQLKEDAGLSHPHYEILVRLAAAPDGEVRMTDLAEGLFTSKSGLTYQVGQLEKRGLVERHSCPTDVRGVLAALTPEGRDVLRAAAPGHVAAVRAALIDVLEPDELDVVARALGRVGRRLRPPAQETGSSDSGGISTSSS
ncbi:MarR family winged helix-turn-helix transcriptional regulator [Streptomyces qinglanensis]|uniref:DNA-binding transcriptional regulator, MarR family n=1 Tax=Streptomyces qinglanensis TaxID=943816 RepID=A0A1H9VK89_9ACTN|nr:MarR family winged helix-turn-helix transcriptional regulator [Streptomyces qinglanensis]SES21958.1 DNA-binding transcriptional regulator, MarR family [Streptomyces qinglanensis]